MAGFLFLKQNIFTTSFILFHVRIQVIKNNLKFILNFNHRIMIFLHQLENKKIFLFIFIIILAISIFLSSYSSIIFQEGNPWPQIKGIIQLNFSGSDIIKISNFDDKYITKSKDGEEIIKNFMENNGYEFIEQMGSGHLFKSLEGTSVVAIHKYYSRYYSLWSITKNLDATEINDDL